MVERRTGRWGLYCTCVFKVLNLVTAVFSFTLVQKMSVAFDKATRYDLEVYTINLQSRGFWGPVHILVPTQCTDMARLQGKTIPQDVSLGAGRLLLQNYSEDRSLQNYSEERSPLPFRLSERTVNDSLVQGNAPGLGNAVEEFSARLRRRHSSALESIEEERLRTMVVPESVRLLEAATEPEQLGNLAKLRRCGENIIFEDLTNSQKYLSMWWLSAIFSPKSSIEESRNLRFMIRHPLLLFMIAFFLLQLFLESTLVKEFVKQKDYAGVTYHPVEGRGQRTEYQYICMYIRKFPRRFFMCWLSMSQQAAYLCLFVTYWERNHYVTQYLPGVGWLLMWGIAMFFAAIAVIKWLFKEWVKFHRLMNKLICLYIACIVPFIIVPMLLLLLYNVKFLFETNVHAVAVHSSSESEALKTGQADLTHARNIALCAGLLHIAEAIVLPGVEVMREST